jgi:hypothetical protein
MDKYPAAWYSKTSKGCCCFLSFCCLASISSAFAAICFSEIPWGAAIVLAELDTEDDVAVVAVLETDILRSESEVVGVMIEVDFFLPKKAAGYEDSISACLGVIVEEEDKGLVDRVGDDGEVDLV